MKLNFIDKYNAVLGAAVAILSAILGEYWFLFLAFLILNVLDFFTGWAKARFYLKEENSKKGLKGIVKKVMYWAMIAFAFLISVVIMEIGQMYGQDLGITMMLGYFVIAALCINEARSIIENFVVMGVYIPPILTKGLEVAEKIVNKNDDEESK